MNEQKNIATLYLTKAYKHILLQKISAAKMSYAKNIIQKIKLVKKKNVFPILWKKSKVDEEGENFLF